MNASTGSKTINIQQKQSVSSDLQRMKSFYHEIKHVRREENELRARWYSWEQRYGNNNQLWALHARLFLITSFLIVCTRLCWRINKGRVTVVRETQLYDNNKLNSYVGFDPLGAIFRLIFETYSEIYWSCWEGDLVSYVLLLQFWSLHIILFQ
jgi:hypothetical protein